MKSNDIKYAPTFKIGQHVSSWNSGLIYIVTAIHELDMCGSYAYSVRRLYGGIVHGPTKTIAESRLYPEQSQ